MNNTYAQILFDTVDNINDCAYTLLLLDQAFDKSIYQFFAAETILKEEKKSIIDTLDLQNHYVKNFLKVLIDDKQFNKFHQIVKDFEDIYLEYYNILPINIEIVHNLESSQLDEIIKQLETQTGKNVIIKQIINPQLIGGIKINYHDKVIDNTIVNKLKKLEKVIKKEVM